MIPLEVPTAIKADTTIHVGEPKFRLPISEKTWLVIFFNLIHLITSQGACGESISLWTGKYWLARDDRRELLSRKAGESARGVAPGDESRRAWNRRSKGRKDGLGLARSIEALTLREPLPGEDANEC